MAVLKSSQQGQTYVTDFICKSICFIAVLHIHLKLSVSLSVVVQLYHVVVVAHHLVDATFLAGILPVVFSDQFVFSNDFLDDVL